VSGYRNRLYSRRAGVTSPSTREVCSSNLVAQRDRSPALAAGAGTPVGRKERCRARLGPSPYPVSRCCPHEHHYTDECNCTVRGDASPCTQRMTWSTVSQVTRIFTFWPHGTVNSSRGGDRRNPMAVPELRQQMRRWLHGEYRAALFTKSSEPVADARYREGTAKTYLTLEILPKKKG